MIKNVEMARLLREEADLLEGGDANPFRMRAYCNVARVAREQAEPVA